MSVNINLLISEASELFSNLKLFKGCPNPKWEDLLRDVVFDLASIAKQTAKVDGVISQEEKLVIAVFLRYPFLNNAEISYFESWKLLTDKEQDELLKSIDKVIDLAVDSLPAQFDSVKTIANLSRQAGRDDLLHRHISHLFRFAQIIANAHQGSSLHEKDYLDRLWVNLLATVAENSGAKDALFLDLGRPKVDDSLQASLQPLEQLIGLGSVKQEIKSLVNLVSIQEQRKKAGLKEVDVSLHAVFSGAPGTGKTTVARLYSRILKALGVLSKGHLIETDRAGMVAEYMGQTAAKVDRVVQEALGGVLFIDEAYSLSSSGQDGNYGQEAIEVLLKRMEDHRNDLVVIVAGYTEPMTEFLNSNPGLDSRFSRKIEFKNYSASELAQILRLMVKDSDYELSKNADSCLHDKCAELLNQTDENFGNGRSMRNIFEGAVRHQANRLVSQKNLDRSSLVTLEIEDLFPK